MLWISPGVREKESERDEGELYDFHLSAAISDVIAL